MEAFQFDNRHRLRSGWNPSAFLIGKPLTDKKIAEYERRGYYSAELREARAELQRRKKAKRELREHRSGEFIKRDGRLIYSPK